MDPHKLPSEYEAVRKALTSQHQIDSLESYLGVSGSEEREKLIKMVQSGLEEDAATVAAREMKKIHDMTLGIQDPPSSAAESVNEMARKEVERTMASAGLSGFNPQTLAEQMRDDAAKFMGIGEVEPDSNLRTLGAIDWAAIDKAAEDREQQLRMEMSFDAGQHLAQQAAEFRRQQDENTDYLRRSAEASEAVLAEERRKKEAAELAARQAKADQGTAEARAERAERREIRMERLAILAAIVAVIALAFAALPYI